MTVIINQVLLLNVCTFILVVRCHVHLFKVILFIYDEMLIFSDIQG